MLIEVEYENGCLDLVMPETLNSLLLRNSVIGFRRADGWVAVGFEAVRSDSRKPFRGAEKRRQDVLHRVEYI